MKGPHAMPSPFEPGDHFAGISLSGAGTRAVIVAANGQVVERREAHLESEKVLQQVTDLVTQLRDLRPIKAVGVGIPGLVKHQNGRVLISPGFPSIGGDDFKSELTKATSVRFQLEKDAVAAAYGEYKAGAGRGCRNIFYVGIRDAISGAIILDDRPWVGASGCAGEVGHITIDPEGVQCVCGNTGCLETVASSVNIVRRAKERLDRDSTSSLSRLATNRDFTARDIVREARNGDDFSMMMIERTGKFIGTAVASVINLLGVERIVLGGGVMEAGELILEPLIAQARSRSFQPCFEATKIVAGELGADAVAIGAALLARDAGSGAQG